MIDSPKQRAEKAMALRRLMSKWFKTQETKKKSRPAGGEKSRIKNNTRSLDEKSIGSLKQS